MKRKLIILNVGDKGEELRNEIALPDNIESSYDFGRNKSNLLKNGMYLRNITIFPSGSVRAMGSETITGKGSGYLFPCAAKEWIETV